MEFWGRLGTNERISFVLTSLIGLFTLVNAAAAVGYYLIYRSSSADATRQTGQLISAANIQAAAANKMAGASETQANKMVELAQQATHQVIAANNLAEQSKRQADIAHDALESVQRAFIVFQNIDTRRMKDSGTGRVSWDFQPIFENSGTTPALYVMNSFVFGGGKGELPESVFLAGGESAVQQQDTIGPKAPRQGPKFGLDESYVFGIFLGDKLENFGKIHLRDDIYFWGWTSYRDVFKDTKTHITEFCRHMVSPQLFSIDPPQIMFNWESCPQGKQHNCADEQCQDYEEVVRFVKNRAK